MQTGGPQEKSPAVPAVIPYYVSVLARKKAEGGGSVLHLFAIC